jgi:hypothetical protein
MNTQLAPREIVEFNSPDPADVDASVAAGRAQLRALIESQAPAATPRRRRPGRVLLAASALACAAVVAGLVVGLTRGDTPSSVKVLNAVAERVSKLPDPAAMGPGQAYYGKELYYGRMWVGPKMLVNPKPGQKGWVQDMTASEYFWVSRTGLKYAMGGDGKTKITFPTARDKANHDAARGGATSGPSLPLVDDSHPDRVFTVGDEHLDYEALQALPSDPAKLETYLRSTVGPTSPGGPSSEVMRAATALLGYPIASDVRAAIFRVVAGLPGVAVVDKVTDAMGRKGQAVEWIDHPYRKQLVFDPNTGVDLETRWYETDPAALEGADTTLAPNSLVDRETIVARGVVNGTSTAVAPSDYAGGTVPRGYESGKAPIRPLR